MNKLQYRPATEQDITALHALYMETSTNPFLAYDIMDETSFRPIYRELLHTGSLVVAEAEGRICGSYHLVVKKYRQSGTVYLSTFAVVPQARGKGYARQILQHIIAQLRSEQKNRIELEVSVNNEQAIGLYQSLGFRIEGTIRQSYRYGNENVYHNDYLMGLLLNE
ncbi:MAG: GNAT family N-acetyltransferase [Chitinophagaceae bacterium]|nr:GNAT family N-acetyltransferase [Chitinophagaceae bacterium]